MIDTSSKANSHSSPKKHPKPLTDEEVKKHHCSHGPNAKCINCLGVTKESIKDVATKCNHPPN